MSRRDYIDRLMRAADLVDAEADYLDGIGPPPPGRSLDIHV